MSDVEYRVAGVLPSAKALQAVIDRLEVAGLDRAQFGVLASRAALFGHGHYETADELAADPSTPTARPDHRSLARVKTASTVTVSVCSCGVAFVAQRKVFSPSCRRAWTAGLLTLTR